MALNILNYNLLNIYFSSNSALYSHTKNNRCVYSFLGPEFVGRATHHCIFLQHTLGRDCYPIVKAEAQGSDANTCQDMHSLKLFLRILNLNSGDVFHPNLHIA
jgi:hypothetical protein